MASLPGQPPQPSTSAVADEGTTSSGGQKRCGVCGEPIIKHRCFHYGATSCYSCRAFFRRACQEGKASSPGIYYTCKEAGACDVSGPDGRRKCRSCRFARCLRAGMQPELVLSQEEKEERFKRYFERKRDDRGAQVPIESKGGDGEQSGSTGNIKEEDEGAAFEEAILGGEASQQLKEEPLEQNSAPPPPPLIGGTSCSAELPPLTFDDIEQVLDIVDPALLPGVGAAEVEEELSVAGRQESPRPLRGEEKRQQGQPRQHVQSHQQQGQQQQQQEQRSQIVGPPLKRTGMNVAATLHDQSKRQPVLVNLYQQQQQQQQQQQHIEDSSVHQPKVMLQNQLKQETPDLEHGLFQASGSEANIATANVPPKVEVEGETTSERLSLREDWKYQKIVEELRMCEEQCQRAASAASMAATAASKAAAHISSGVPMMPPLSNTATLESGSFIHRRSLTSSTRCQDRTGEGQMMRHQQQQQQVQHVDLQQQKHHPFPLLPDRGSGVSSAMDAFSLNYTLFSQACAKASRLHPNSGPTLVRRHRRGAPPATSRDMQDTMQLILAQFKCYLGLLPFYQSLAEEDQASLLARNSKLYLMFVLGRYFSALSGQEQLLWILGEDDPQVKGSSSLGMETVFIPFQSLSVPGAAGNMFEAGNHLLDLCYKLKLACPVLPNRKHLVAQLLSFASDVRTDLSNPDMVAMHQKMIESMLHLQHYPTFSKVNQRQIHKILPNLAEVFDMTFAWSLNLAGKRAGAAGEVVMPFTKEERDTILHMVGQFNQAFKAVPSGSLSTQFVMRSFGLPLGPIFYLDSTKMFMERFRQALLTFQEFQAKSSGDQSRYLMTNGNRAVTLHILMLEGCRTGLEQLLHVCSDLDLVDLHMKFGHHFLTPSCPPHLSISDMGVLPVPEIAREYLGASSRLSRLVQYTSRTFQLMVLLMLFPEGDSAHFGLPSIPGMRKRYLRLLDHELTSAAASASASTTTLPEVMSALGEVDRLAQMMQALALGGPPPPPPQHNHTAADTSSRNVNF